MGKLTLSESNEQYIVTIKHDFGGIQEEVFKSIDEASIYIKNYKVYCNKQGYNYRFEDLVHDSKNNIGRPSLGKTKKVSITLPEELWEKIEINKGKKSMSAFLREVIIQKYE